MVSENNTDKKPVKHKKIDFEQLRKTLKVDETKANNLTIMLSMCIEENDYSNFYKYLNSEIKFCGGIKILSEKIDVNLIEVKKFLNSKRQPNLKLLSGILNGLGYNLKIVENKIW